MKYKTSEERKAAHKEANKRWREKNPTYYANYYKDNKEKLLEDSKQYYQDNKEEILKKVSDFNNTPIGRATYLIKNYDRNDAIHNRGKGDLTPEWIIESIFTQPCVYCGKSGWDIIGCNRIDNSKPHTKDNVEPCCKDCNDTLAGEENSKRVYQYSLDGELIAVWTSVKECGRNGYSRFDIHSCCNGKRKTHKGYRWSYVPL